MARVAVRTRTGMMFIYFVTQKPMAGLLWRKLEMTRVVQENGLIPVTLIEVPEIIVSQIKTQEKDWYEAVVLKVLAGKKNWKEHFTMREVPMSDKMKDLNIWDKVGLELLEGIEEVKVVGTSKWKWFAWAMKRWNFSGWPKTHGSKFHRALGSIGTRKPTRTKPGKKMHGHMWNARVTLKWVKVVHIDKEQNIVALKWGMPWARRSLIVLNF